MSTILQSFVKSPLGSFIKSPLGVRGNNGVIFVIIPDTATNEIEISKNGKDWTHYEGIVVATTDLSSICFSLDLNLFCAVGNSTFPLDAVITSPNGIDWTSHTGVGRSGLTGVIWLDICWSSDLGLFCAVGDNFTITNDLDTAMTSPDGINWILQTFPIAGRPRGIVWVSELGLFVAVGVQGTGIDKMHTSPDGTNWTRRTGPNRNWEKVCWSPELEILCAVNSDPANLSFATSTDGINWTLTATLSASIIGGGTGICWSPELGLFCAISTGGSSITLNEQIFTSPDGTNWTGRTILRKSWKGITWSPKAKIFCAVSNTSILTNDIAVSSNGIDWTTYDSFFRAKGICVSK